MLGEGRGVQALSLHAMSLSSSGPSHECPAMTLLRSAVGARAVRLHACLVLSCTLAAVPDLKFILIPSLPLPFTSSWTTGVLKVEQIFF